jgi:23S rRNA pseudouridine1911/1915/1917 synthase
MIDILYEDEDIVVCIKPSRVLSTDEPGGLPEMLRQTMATKDFRTVHRLDRVVSGLMVVARSAAAASELSRQIREDSFQKEYQAVVHGCVEQQEGRLTDLLLRDKARKMTMVVTEPGKDVQPAALRYQILGGNQELTRVRIQLETGRTHQIRVQFASRGFPLVGERKYSELNDPCEIALWSYRLAFTHPITGRPMEFVQDPPAMFPWTEV